MNERSVIASRSGLDSQLSIVVVCNENIVHPILLVYPASLFEKHHASF